MRWFTLRPTFDIQLLETSDHAVQKIARAYQFVENKKLFLLFGEYGELHLPTSEHRVWSPQLSFSVNPKGDHSFIHGRFAPRLEVWTFVWICYLALAFTAFFGFILGFSQFMIGSNAWGIWIGIVAMMLWGALIAIAHVGQQLSVDQMRTLQSRLVDFISQADLRLRE